MSACLRSAGFFFARAMGIALQAKEEERITERDGLAPPVDR